MKSIFDWKIFNDLQGFVVMFSSCFFISLFAVVLSRKLLVFDYSIVLLTMIASLLFIYAYIISKIGLLKVWFLLTGSVIFIISYISYLFQYPEIVADLYSNYIELAEPVINQLVIKIFLSGLLVIFGIFILIKIFEKIIKLTEEKIGERTRKWLEVAFIVSLTIYFILWSFFTQTGEMLNLIMDQLSNYLIPIFSFSLLYVHSNYILNYVSKHLIKKKGGVLMANPICKEL